MNLGFSGAALGSERSPVLLMGQGSFWQDEKTHKHPFLFPPHNFNFLCLDCRRGAAVLVEY
jgi:hypothetical protein